MLDYLLNGALGRLIHTISECSVEENKSPECVGAGKPVLGKL